MKTKKSALKTKKSTGPDGISPKLLKLAGSAIVPPLTMLYTLSVNTSTVFHDWKKARLIPAHKKNDETDRGNYRPLSMLSVPSKIMESCVTDTLTQHAYVDNELVTDKQWAYRKGHSAELFLVQLTDYF